MEAALQLFVEKGIDGAPTALIARAAGVSNGTLFHYFLSKEVLITALNEHIVSSRDAQALAGSQEVKTIKEKVRTMWENRITWSIRHEAEHLFLCQMASHSLAKRLKLNENAPAAFMEWMETGIRQNLIGFMPVDYLHTLFEGNLEGMVNYLKKNPVKFRTPEFMRQSFEWYWNSVRNHSVRSVLN